MGKWEDCEHEWAENTWDDIADGKPDHTQVHCTKCKCPGERFDPTGE